ncbi:MAG: HAD family hydrolase [Clostridia bacterium]
MKIIFDLDGTLFSSGNVAIKAFRKVFEKLDLEAPPNKKLLSTLGYPIGEIWEFLIPEDKEKRVLAKTLMEEIENEMIKEGQGQLFSDVLDTLKALKSQGHTLMILSNCDKPYLDVISKRFKFEKYFAGLYCAGMFDKLTKSEILKQLLSGDKNAVMVGDRFHDVQAGIDNDIKTIWCNYGYSDEILDADYEIHKFSKILDIIDELPRS